MSDQLIVFLICLGYGLAPLLIGWLIYEHLNRRQG